MYLLSFSILKRFILISYLVFSMYKIKVKPEDFVVREVLKLDFYNGKYVYFLLKKRNWTTLDAVEKIAEKLKISRKNFGYAGNKDKKAITEQIMSAFNVNEEKLDNLKIKDLEIGVLGKGSKPISLGDLDGNEFEIVVRDLDKEYEKVNFIENYFDEQRFGNENIIIGKFVVQKKFKEACEYLGLKVERNDFVGTLRSLGIRRLQFYLHSYQSYLWNLVVAEYLKRYNHFVVNYKHGELVFLEKKINNLKIPLINFNTMFNNKEIKNIYSKVLEMEGIKQEDFLIKQIPEILTEGAERDLFIDVRWYLNEFFENEKIQKINFFLPKGAYATILIKKMFSNCR